MRKEGKKREVENKQTGERKTGSECVKGNGRGNEELNVKKD